jgi:hypothetical protein
VKQLLVVFALVLSGPAAKAAEPYLSTDLALERTSGAYHYGRIDLGVANNFATNVSGYGVALGAGFGLTFRSSVAIALEGSLATDSASAEGIQSFGNLGRFRAGARFELRDEPPFYARAAFGLEWLRVGRSDDELAAGWAPENMHGLYGSLSVGLRTAHLGPFLRADIAHDISEHAAFTPVTLALGADLTF